VATDRSSRIVVDREPITLSVALDEVIAYYAVLTRSPTPMQGGRTRIDRVHGPHFLRFANPTLEFVPLTPSPTALRGSRPIVAWLDRAPHRRWDLVALMLPLLLLSLLSIVELQRMLGSAERLFVPLLLGFVAFEVGRELLSTRVAKSLAGQDSVTPLRMRLAIALLCVGLTAGILAWWVISPWLAYVASTICFLAWSLGRFPSLPWYRGAAWFCLLMWTIRLPIDWDLVLMTRLQGFSAWACDKALDTLWVPHLRAASTIELPGKAFFIEEACSGVTSLFALFAISAVSLYLRGDGLVVAVASLSTVPLWAVTGNFFRLLAITLGYHHFGRDLASGLDHDLLGIASFATSVLGYCMTESIIRAFCGSISTAHRHYEPIQEAVNRALVWPHRIPLLAAGETLVFDEANRTAPADRDGGLAVSSEARQPWGAHPKSLYAVLTLLMLLCLFSVAGVKRFTKANAGLIVETELPDISDVDLKTFPQEDRLPKRLEGGWERAEYRHIRRPFQDPMGQHSLSWTFAIQDASFLLSLDFPYRGAHGLEYCYHYAGWTVTDITLIDDERDGDWPYMELKLRNDLGFAAYVCYSTFSDRGEPVRWF
jgi:exosortase